MHYGFVEDLHAYARWLKRADIVPVTSIHDFFGCSVIEAVYMGCHPILPRRLAYPEHLPEELHEKYLYDDFDGLTEKLEAAVVDIGGTRKTSLKACVEKYGWGRLAPVYDEEMERVALE